jgi:hypothetical protein
VSDGLVAATCTDTSLYCCRASGCEGGGRGASPSWESEDEKKRGAGQEMS